MKYTPLYKKIKNNNKNMSCIIDNGYSLGCATTGGIERVWLGTYDGEVTYTLGADDEVTALDNNPSDLTAYSFEHDIEQASLVSPATPSRENGTIFYEMNLGVKFFNLDKKTRNLVKALGKAPLFAVVKANNGQYYILGVNTAGRVSEGSADLGQALGDMNGATLTINFKSADPIHLTEEAILNFTGTPDATKITVAPTV